MSNQEKTIKVKVLEVPVGCIVDVAYALNDKEITNTLIGSNDEDDLVFIEVSYSKEERKAMNEIEDIIDNFESDDDEDEDNE